MNGLSIDEKDFEKLPIKQQVSLLYQNTEEIKTMLSVRLNDYEFKQKLQWTAIGIVAILGGIAQYFKLL